VKRFLTLALFLFLLIPSQTFAANRDQVPAMLDVARAHFGVDQCGGKMEVTFVPAGRVNDDGHRVYGSAWDCKMSLDEQVYDEASWPRACRIVVHEYGHAAVGIEEHSLDPFNIMAKNAAAVFFPPCTAANPANDLWAIYMRHQNRWDELRLRCTWLRDELHHRPHSRYLRNRLRGCRQRVAWLDQRIDALRARIRAREGQIDAP
jgi:hypothetical protein